MRDDLEAKLNEALAECATLREENERLKALLGLDEKVVDPAAKAATKKSDIAVDNNSSTEKKIAVFRKLFQGRDDVFAVRWENKKGAGGYVPACRHEWNRALCRKPAVKCGQCENRELLPLTDQVIVDHLTGRLTVGLYPLLRDETCRVLAVDFDKTSWRQDIRAFKRNCDKMGVPAAVESSRSGNGGHIWIFFDSPIGASLARKLGCAILTRTMDDRPQVGLDSYDRFFPS